MQLFPKRREIRRAQTRMVTRLFAVMAMLTLLFAGVLAGRYLFGWW